MNESAAAGAQRASRRIAMAVEYDGSAFSGWQIQPHARTVQACLEEAIGRVAAHPVRLACAGRTDAGVHAEAQIVHFDTHARRSSRAWALGSNVNSPPDVGVRWAVEVPGDFHARHSARARHYRYLIQPRATRSALMRNRAVWVHHALDVERMREAAQSLVGERDFTSFRAAGCQANTPVRRVHYLEIERRGDLIELRIGANAFLHHMVRNIAGVLMAIGRGDMPTSWTAELLVARDRAAGGVTAPAQGLYLVAVDYPPIYRFPTFEAPFVDDQQNANLAANKG